MGSIVDVETPDPPLAQSVVAPKTSWQFSRAQLYADLCEAKLDRLFQSGGNHGCTIGELPYRPKGQDSGFTYWDLYADFIDEIRILGGGPSNALWYRAPREYPRLPAEDVWHVAHAATIDPYEIFLKKLQAVDNCRHDFSLIVHGHLRCRRCGQ